MKQTVIIGILLEILLLTGCDNNEKEHDFVGIFTTANGIKFESSSRFYINHNFQRFYDLRKFLENKQRS